ncbi:MAG: hypothetical protein EPO23_11935 [Xanthobacteraceae bacterium]|nr:MAG: hypothetical protein EPO23_11935 [Xanthobacteraceae bacterium]
MPPLLLWALGAVGGAVAARWAMREIRRVNRELDRMRTAHMAEAARKERPQRLRRDPATGTYRPE